MILQNSPEDFLFSKYENEFNFYKKI